jgi:DNA (cytosine-5)-methyltransferase 1
MLKVLDLFSGIGGFSLGLERTGGFQTVAFCEIEPFCRRVLEKHWPSVPIHEDVRKLKGSDVGTVDVVCGGYPCQPFSSAGKRGGSSDDRWLWPEMRRLVDELRPAWVIGENVTGHINMGLDAVLSDLEAIDYACRAFAIPALGVGAPHRRERVWVVGHPNRNGESTVALNDEASWLSSHLRAVVPLEWFVEPDLDRMDDGLSNRMDRLRGLGNAVVPQIPEIIGRAILAAEAA